MGARTTWEIRGHSDDSSIYLYSHWGGDSKWVDTASALAESEPRWGDVSYASRIFISQIIGNNWNSETGYGIVSDARGVSPFEEEYFSVVVDFSNNTIEVGSEIFSFHEFLASDDKTEEIMESIWSSV